MNWPDERSRRTWLAWARPLGGIAILGVVVGRLGTGPFLDGIRRIDGWSLGAAVGISLLTTVCCAWRWSLVARGLGVGVPLGPAVASYYRSQFLNTTLPGGVLGDVHRGVVHGRDVGDVSRGLRAVAWERFAGQGVQIALTFIVLIVLPSPARSSLPVVATVLVVLAVGAALLRRSAPRPGSSRRSRTVRAASADLRDGLFARTAWPGIALASGVVVAGHTATFLIAARTAGSTASPLRLLPLAMIVLLAAAVPANVGGWGPREGVAAWAFGAAGLGASQGIAAATVFGVMVAVASLPGAALLIVAWLRSADRSPQRAGTPHPADTPHPAGARRLQPAIAGPDGAEHA